jgi:23S rRNA pseudouridine2605 synthase
VAGVPSQELLDKIRRGITLAEGRVHAKRVEIRSQHKQSAVLEMTLDEGKNREIRRMLARLGHKVHQLKRVAIGPLSLGNLLPSQWRQLSWTEIEALRQGAIQAVGVAEASRLDTAAPDDRPGRGRGSDRPRSPRPGPGGRGLGGKPRAGRPTTGGPRKPRRPGKASSWRKPRG